MIPGAISFVIPGKPFWRPVPGCEGSYEASSEGEVRSVPRRIRHKSGHWQTAPGKVLRQHVGIHGYPSVVLSIEGRLKTRTVHSLVMETFVGPRPEGMEVRHLNGDRRDPRLINLAYGTRAQNSADRVAHGTAVIGEANPAAKLSGRQVDEIRRRVGEGEAPAVVSRDYGVSSDHVSAIVRRRVWSHR